ncbi:MAG: DUF6036 family nucleotidyltransferase [Saccharofermentans sp.]|nr:DUF6036 family nucleotidyltransferase [Saccharofermentans sp.]
MMQSEKKITKNNVIDILKRFAKEYRKELGKVPGEIVIVGGGSIMLNYSFRDATQDLDVILRTTSDIEGVINKFADDNNLPSDWMNTSFTKTESYSHILPEISQHCCTLNNGTLEIRTVSGVYLIAMKLRAHREYRNDISDAIGILKEERSIGNIISISDIKSAYSKLYQSQMPEELVDKMAPLCVMSCEELDAHYKERIESENNIGEIITKYRNESININSRNVNEVIAKIKKKMNRDNNQ